MKKPSATTPLILIAIGVIWFLNSAELLPATNTMIAGALALAGICIFIFDGINKSTIFSGPLLIYIAGAIYVWHNYSVPLSPILALGLVFLGILMLLSRLNAIPVKTYKSNKKPSLNSNSDDKQ